MSGSQSGVDPDLLAAWVAGWCLSRGVAPPTPAYGGFRVEVGLSDQKARYVFPDVGPGVAQASRDIREPHVFLKVCASPRRLLAVLDQGWAPQPLSTFMVTDDLTRHDAPLQPAYHWAQEAPPSGFSVEIKGEHDEVAASGRVFVVGDLAVFDKIATHPDHQRRGLGRAVMARLGLLAAESGAKTGALVATSDGRALYGTIGWRAVSLYSTAVRAE